MTTVSKSQLPPKKKKIDVTLLSVHTLGCSKNDLFKNVIYLNQYENKVGGCISRAVVSDSLQPHGL